MNCFGKALCVMIPTSEEPQQLQHEPIALARFARGGGSFSLEDFPLQHLRRSKACPLLLVCDTELLRELLGKAALLEDLFKGDSLSALSEAG